MLHDIDDVNMIEAYDAWWVMLWVQLYIGRRIQAPLIEGEVTPPLPTPMIVAVG